MRTIQPGLLATALASLTAACGGSGPTDTPPPPPPPSAVVAVITVTPPSASLSLGGTQVLSAVAKNAAGQTVSATFTWHTSLASVATVDAAGRVTAISQGVANITALSGGVTSNSVGLTVTAIAGIAGSVVVDKASVLLPAIGRSAQLTAQILDLQGAPSGGTVTWTSSAPDNVSIDAAGLLVAKAIGSAQIFAEAGGVRSAPTLVFVAEPQAGALLLSDAQIVSVGPPLPGAGTAYEVTVQGVTAPSPGTVVLAAESAPVAGKVITTRQGAAGLVVTLAIAPLYQLFSAYNIALTLDLSAFPLEDLPVAFARSARSAQPSLGALWNAERGQPRGLAAVRVGGLASLGAFDCDGSIKPQLIGSAVTLSVDNKLKLVLDDRPGYSKHALEGSLALTADAGLKLKAGFQASGKCEAQARFKLPVLGWFSVIIMPSVRLGFGAALEGKLTLVQGELSVQGKVGISGTVGWECGGSTPACRGLEQITPLRDLKTKSKIPSENDMEVDVSAQFYVLAGLDATVGLGVFNGEILEARFGPTQSFNLAFEEDQAARTSYAAKYDLKLEGVVEPGDALKKAIKAVIDDDGVGVSFKAEISEDISESPKGSLSASKARVRPGADVDFTVDLAPPGSVAYWILGYNVTGVELYRKREDELEFTPWKSMSLIGSHRATYKWTPVEADAGKYEFAAFVNTQLLTPLLEVSPNSITPVEVSCFSGGSAAASGPQAATTCADTWAGTGTLILNSGLPGANQTSTYNITWTHEPSLSVPGHTYYSASGSFNLAFSTPQPGCTIALAPNTFAIVPYDSLLPPSKLEIIDNGFTPATYSFTGGQMVDFTSTISCPGEPDRVDRFFGLWIYALGSGPFTVGQASLVGTTNNAAVQATWDFRRP